MMRFYSLLGAVLLFSPALPAQDLPDYTPVRVEARAWEKGRRDMPWKTYPTRVLDSLRGFRPGVHTPDRYGSDPSVKFPATGFFHAVRAGDRWWMVDPDGCRHLNVVVVGLRQGGSERNREAFVRCFGDERGWMKSVSSYLYSLGFTGAGSWSDEKAVERYNASRKTSERVLTHTPILSFMSRYGAKRSGTYQLPGNTGYPNQCIFVFDPEFEAFCDEHARQLVRMKDDPTIVGYFSDNELPFGKKNLEGYLSLPDPDDPGRRAAEEWMKKRGITRDGITDEDRIAFAGVVAERYYSIVSRAIRRYDPNHMYLGSRLHGAGKFLQPVIEAAGRHCDVVSINYYGHWTPSPKYMKRWGEWAGKPFIITEFYTKAMDSGLTNETGAGYTVRTQADRGRAYQHFTLGLLESGNCVGWHWFKYQDNDPTAKGVDPSNLNSNKGLVNNDYEPYTPLASMMKAVNTQVYTLADYFDLHRRR